MALYESPIREVVAALLLLAAGLAAARGARRLRRGLAQALPLDVVRGLRAWAISLSAVAFAVGVFCAETGFLVLGAVFLAEELYETAVLAAILRADT
jgi:hypothetical protein